MGRRLLSFALAVLTLAVLFRRGPRELWVRRRAERDAAQPEQDA